MLQDRSDGDLGEFGVLANEFIAHLNGLPQIQNAFTSFNPNFPQTKLDIDYEKAKAFVKNPEDYDFYKILNWDFDPKLLRPSIT